jgi:hypothetical protein
MDCAARSPEGAPDLSPGFLTLNFSTGGCLPWTADKRRQPLDPCDNLLAEAASMVTNLQPRPFPFEAAHRFSIDEYHRLVEEGRLEEKPRSVELLDGRISGSCCRIEGCGRWARKGRPNRKSLGNFSGPVSFANEFPSGPARDGRGRPAPKRSRRTGCNRSCRSPGPRRCVRHVGGQSAAG